MTSVNDSTLMPAALRDIRRMNQFVSVAAAVAGLLFGLDIGVIAGALPSAHCLTAGCRSVSGANTA